MKKILFFIGTLIALFIINSLIQSIFSLTQKNTVVEEAKRNLEAQKAENTRLKKQLAEVKDPSFIEKEARNKLFLVKPGEQVVLIPSPSPMPTGAEKVAKKIIKPHWVEWYEFFFRNG